MDVQQIRNELLIISKQAGKTSFDVRSISSAFAGVKPRETFSHDSLSMSLTFEPRSADRETAVVSIAHVTVVKNLDIGILMFR
jgi:hypothetical protein